MDREEAFLQAMTEYPANALIFADWLEERGDPRGELLRLAYLLTRAVDPPNRPAMEARLRDLVAAGTPAVGPFRTNALGMRFVWIPPGTFRMGSSPQEQEPHEDETQHHVTLTKGFYLGIYSVAQAPWLALMGNNPSYFQGDDLPVEQVSWDEAVAFCETLGKQDGTAYRLPTEAEWEYACRAGTTTPFHFGDTISTDQANFKGTIPYGKSNVGEYRRKITPVGSFNKPNAWGLHDMHGNVWEWCADWYGPYQTDAIKDPFNNEQGDARVLRGGSWSYDAWGCRAAHRSRRAPGARRVSHALRVCFFLD